MNTKRTSLESAIEAMGGNTGKEFSYLMYDFLDIALGLLCNNPNDRQKELLTKTFSDKKRKEAFICALEAYGEEAKNYHDPLGELFMMRISHGNNGQFFTPDDICQMMARITEPCGGSINDPTCGSGRTLLAALMASREKGVEPYLYGNDISYTCAQMTLMNLLFNCAKGEVSCGDALLYDLSTFRFFRIDRAMMPDGCWVSTYWQYTLDNIDEVDTKRQSWIRNMISNGIPIEMEMHNEEETMQEPGENDRLTANPKAIQLELF